MAPTPDDQFSAPGSVSYDSNDLVVGDGTWDFTKNTFLLPNLQGTPFETTRYNGMGNRFSTLTQYHNIILAHGILAALVFLLFVPSAVFTARFYARRPGYAVRYHARLQIAAGLLLLVVFILGNLAVGPKRSLTNPHHGIGVAIFVLFILQIVGGRIIRHIVKAHSLRITIHQWSGRTIALLGIVQIPLGLTLYGSPRYLFILYAVWMAFLVLLYFILNYRAGSRREIYMKEMPRSEAGRTRVTESEYFSEHHSEGGNKWKWLGPLAAGAGAWTLFRGRNKDKNRGRSRSPSPSYVTSRGPEVLPSRRGSASYLTSEKMSEYPAERKKSGGFMKMFGGAAAAIGAGKLVSGFMNRRDKDHRTDDYSAVSTETPRRHRPGRRGAETDLTTELTEDYRGDPDGTSLLSPVGDPVVMAGARSAADTRLGGRPTTPQRSRPRGMGRRRSFDDSEYSSYVSPSRRVPDEPRGGGGGMGKGLLAGLGMGWFGKKLADRKVRKEEGRIQDEEDMRSGVSGSRFTGDGYPSPTRKPSRRPTVRRPTGFAPATTHTEMSESSFESRPTTGYTAPPLPGPIAPVPLPVPAPGSHSRSRSRVHSRAHSRSQSRTTLDPVSMPAMPGDPSEMSYMSGDTRPTRRGSSRRRAAGERASAVAAASAQRLAADEDNHRERVGSPHSQPVSVKLKMHDDRDRNVTLRRLTEEEAKAARGRSRADSESSLSGFESPSQGRGRYRRNSSQRRAEASAERTVEADTLAPLSPPNPTFAKNRRAKDSAYYSGPATGLAPPAAAGPSGQTPAAGQTVSSLGDVTESHGTWSQMSGSPSAADSKATAAADNRRRRRLERRRGSNATVRPQGTDMFD